MVLGDECVRAKARRRRSTGVVAGRIGVNAGW
jgi:hypothetical protein